MTLTERVDHYVSLLHQHDMMMAIELYYDDNIVQHEPTGEPLIGKQILAIKEKAVQDQIDIDSCQVKITSINDESGRVEGSMHFEFRSAEDGAKVLDERFVQMWRNGKIVEQRFFY